MASRQNVASTPRKFKFPFVRRDHLPLIGRIGLPLLAPILAVFYGVGDQMKVWDDFTGRSACVRGYERLSSAAGFPKSWIYRGDPDFAALEKLLVAKSTNETVRDVRSATPFVLITRGDVSLPLKTRVPSDYPDPTFVPDSSPVLLITGKLTGTRIEGGMTHYASSLGDVKRWVDDAKNLERFWVSTVLISLLGIVIAFRDGLRTVQRETYSNRSSNSPR